MGKSQREPDLSATEPGFRPVQMIAPVCLIVFTLWQGSYFPVQFFLIIALFLLALVIFGKSLTVTKETVMLFAISVVYCISLAAFSENHYTGLAETMRTLVFPLSLILFLNTDSARMEKSLFIALICVAALGLLEYAQVIHIPGGVDESRGRIHSVLQYANANALLMLIGILYSIRDFVSQKKIISLCFCAMFAAALFLTGSRTTLVIALATCALYLFIISGRRGKTIVVCTVLLIAAIAVSLSALTDIRMFRLSLFESTLVERWITFQDAVSMLRGRWLTGIGVGNWQEWQMRFQTAPYYVKYIHNYYLQLLLDGGLVAPALFCTAMFPAVYRGIRSKSVHGVILFAFLLHALLDIAPVFAAVAVIAMYSLSQLTVGGKSLNIGRLRFAAIAPLLAVMVLWGSELSSSIAIANRDSGNLDAAMGANKVALALNPLNTDLYYQLALSARDAEMSEGYARKSIEKNPNNLRAIAYLAQIESGRGNFEAALELCDRLIEGRRFFEGYQSLYRDIADYAMKYGSIDSYEYDAILARIDAIPQQINPLYTQFHKSEIGDEYYNGQG